jgi:hypothetical protein
MVPPTYSARPPGFAAKIVKDIVSNKTAVLFDVILKVSFLTELELSPRSGERHAA